MLQPASNFRSARRARLTAAALAGIAATGALLLPGCSGSSSSSHAVVRAVNTISEEGQLQMIINNGSVNGTQKYGEASGYLYFPSDGTSTAAFALSSTITTYPLHGSITFNVTGTNPYTLIAYGDPTNTSQTSPLSPNILILTDNTAAIPQGDALLRIANCAPAAGAINYSLSGGAPVTLAYGTTSGSASDSYLVVPAGQTTLAVTNASTGANLFSTPTQTLPLAAGSAYTVLISEPTYPNADSSSTTVSASTPVSYDTILLHDR